MEPRLKRYIGVKDLAQVMGVCPRSVKNWWRRLHVPPTIQGHSGLRWSPKDYERFMDRWRAFTVLTKLCPKAAREMTATWTAQANTNKREKTKLEEDWPAKTTHCRGSAAGYIQDG